MSLQSPEMLLCKLAPCPAMHAAVSASSMLLGQILPASSKVSCITASTFAHPVIDQSTIMHASLGLCRATQGSQALVSTPTSAH